MFCQTILKDILPLLRKKKEGGILLSLKLYFGKNSINFSKNKLNTISIKEFCKKPLKGLPKFRLLHQL